MDDLMLVIIMYVVPLCVFVLKLVKPVQKCCSHEIFNSWNCGCQNWLLWGKLAPMEITCYMVGLHRDA